MESRIELLGANASTRQRLLELPDLLLQLSADGSRLFSLLVLGVALIAPVNIAEVSRLNSRIVQFEAFLALLGFCLKFAVFLLCAATCAATAFMPAWTDSISS